jgi:hypothetical protein
MKKNKINMVLEIIIIKRPTLYCIIKCFLIKFFVLKLAKLTLITYSI